MVDSATMPLIQRSASQPATLMDPLTIRGAYCTLLHLWWDSPSSKTAVEIVESLFLTQPHVDRLGGIDGGVLEDGEETLEGVHSKTSVDINI